MFFILSKVLDLFLSPLVWVFILLLMSFVIKRPSLKKRFFYTAFFVLLMFSNPFLADLAFRAWEGAPVPMSTTPIYETGIVLTGVASSSDTAPDRVFFGKGADRVLHTVQLYKAGKVKNILISGGSGALTGRKVSEAILLKRAFLYSGVADSAILIEGSSRNTVESAQYCRELMDSLQMRSKVLLITSAFHMPRALGCFKKADIAVDGYTTDFYTGDKRFDLEDLIVPRESALLCWSILIHEVFGYYVYKLMGYT